ncbi:MAG: PAS domain S-box protein [Elusimicrobiota bacterium]
MRREPSADKSKLSAYREFFEASPEPVWVVDAQTLRYVDVNAAAERKYGYSREEFLRLRMHDLHAEEESGRLQALTAVSRGEELHGIGAWRHKTKDGSLLDAEVVFHRVQGEGRTLLLAIIQDITAQRRIEESLRGVRHRLRSVVGNVPVVLFAVDQTGMFTLSEGRGLEGLGLKPGEVIGRSIFEFYADNDRVLRNIRRALNGETVTDIVREGGLYFETHYVPQSGPAGRADGVMGVAIDITRRRQVELEREELLRRERDARVDAESANRAKDEFLAILSHELRTPMTAMLGWTWLLRSKQMPPGEFSQVLDSIERNMKLQAQVIEDLLDVSRIVTGQLRLDVKSVEINAILAAAVDVARPAAAGRSIKLKLEMSDDPVWVAGDSARLQQVFWNLLSNAVKFTPEGGCVTARLGMTPRKAEVRITDTGMGIAPEFLPHVFERFLQGEHALTREHGGLGLGTAIVRHLVEMHGGTVQASSPGPGQGAEFTVFLPLTKPAEPAPTPQAYKPPEGRPAGPAFVPDLEGLSVLLVDDDPGTRDVLQAALEHCGARVRTAASAADAMEALQNEKPDLLLCDILMPQEDGISLIRRIRALRPEQGGDVPAAALTALSRPEDRTNIILAGFQMHLPKPIHLPELAAVVRALARR